MHCLSQLSGGAKAYLRNVAPLLCQHFKNSPEGHTLKLLAHNEQRDLLEFVDPAQIIWVTGERPAGKKRVIWELKNLPRIIESEGIDVFFNPYQIGPNVPNVKQVLMLQNMEPFLCKGLSYSFNSRVRNYLLKEWSTYCLKKADRVISISEFVKKYLVQNLGIEKSRIRLIYHGTDQEKYLKLNPGRAKDVLEKLGVREKFILTCGSLLPYRRCEDVIGAFSKCAEKIGENVQLVIAGTGNDKKCHQLIENSIKKSPYRNRICRVGFVPWELMIDLYKRSLCCVLATEIEACSIIAIEAMTMGCAIISSDCPPLPEILNGSTLQFESRNVDQLANRILHCVEDENVRKKLKSLALNRAKDFSWVKCGLETYSALTDWQQGENDR